MNKCLCGGVGAVVAKRYDGYFLEEEDVYCAECAYMGGITSGNDEGYDENFGNIEEETENY